MFDKIKQFPSVFWSANTTELFERAAYYAMASFLVLYLQRIGMGNYWPSTLNALLWGFVYFLPIISGSLADHFGFKKALITAFVLLSLGYVLIGLPVWSGMAKMDNSLGHKKHKIVQKDSSRIKNKSNNKTISPKTKNINPIANSKPIPKNEAKIDKTKDSNAMTASIPVFMMIVFAFIVIGIGGSIIKPCISGAVQKFSPPALATLGFGIFYMVINIGSLFGRGVSYFVRTNSDLSSIFIVSGVMSVFALIAVIKKYEEPKIEIDENKKSLKTTFANMFLVLRQGPFMVFLLIDTGFAFIYHQVYNIIPLYLNHFVEDSPPVELYTMANPFVIVFFQLLITRVFGKMKALRSIVVGMLLISVAMIINIIPLLAHVDLRTALIGSLPIGGMYAIATVAIIAFGELFEASRRFEFIGKLAPKGQEGLYMGYANLPMALGSFIGGPVGAYIFYDIMIKRNNQVLGWLILAGVGVVSAVASLFFALWLEKHNPKTA